MREFDTPLSERLRLSRYKRERYARDPEFRLDSINRSRVRRGLPPRASVEEIGATRNLHSVRDERGRFA